MAHGRYLKVKIITVVLSFLDVKVDGRPTFLTVLKFSETAMKMLYTIKNKIVEASKKDMIPFPVSKNL